MSGDSSFDRHMALLNGRGTRNDGAAEVYHRFARRLVGLASKAMDARLRHKVGPEDVVQSVFKSFFRNQAQGQFDLGGWDDLWSLLAFITLRKCSKQAERWRRGKRDVRREVSPPAGDEADGLWGMISREPTPEQALALEEAVETFLGGLGERERPVAALRLQGLTDREISAALGRTEYTVKGILKKVRERLRSLADDEDSPV